MESEFLNDQNLGRWQPFGITAAEATQLSLPRDGESEPRQKASAFQHSQHFPAVSDTNIPFLCTSCFGGLGSL